LTSSPPEAYKGRVGVVMNRVMAVHPAEFFAQHPLSPH
jgi:hypothetical protein